MAPQRNLSSGRIVFSRPLAFWLGTIALSVGTFLHIPMFVHAAHMGYQLVGMPIDGWMILGMILIVVGLGMAVYGLIPKTDPEVRARLAHIRVKALDDVPLGRTHIVLLTVLAIAILIDIMKPTTLGFVVPGMAKEYGLKSPLNPDGKIPVALLPLSGITGTVLGSFIWGWMADWIGRRPTILLAALLFIATSICGAMPTFSLNLLMCFLMGLSVGGMLPIAYALTAETIPARHRGLLMILMGGDLSLAYFVTSALSAWLQPEFGWRILWLIGAPTGLLLILISRWIPESPRFLLATGRTEEAKQIMDRFGASIVEVSKDEALAVEQRIQGRFSQLFKKPFIGLSVGLGLYAVAFGLVQFGFLLWLPTNLRVAGFDVAAADSLIARASLLGFPVTFISAFLYAFWSSKKTLLLFAMLTCAALLGFVFFEGTVTQNTLLIYGLIVLIIMGVSTATTDLMPTYAAEVYPTSLRGRGSGFIAGASKVGGVLGIGLVVAGITPPTFTGAALLGAIPLLLALVVLAIRGIETRRRRLEEITAEQVGADLVS